MNIAILILQLLPMALQVVKGVEDLVSGAKQGTLKKSVAVGTIQTGLDVAAKAGGLKQSDTDKVKPVVGDVVDGLVSVLNGAGMLKPQDTTQSA